MSKIKLKKDEIELLSNKDITNLLLEESAKPLNTATLFKKVIKLLNLPSETFENKIADYYTALSTDKRFILLEDGTWDLRARHTSDKILKLSEEDEEDEPEETKEEPEEAEEDDEDSYNDSDDNYHHNSKQDDLKDLVIIDEDELEEQ